MSWRWERGDLGRLVDLWHADCFPGADLETVVREETGWSHEEYGRWVVTGSPDAVKE